ncbi:MAG TPA: helix-turn-helix transcriptional regulator [Terriglobales bacterium]|nr:helix-turn-helix transcriptional regulator [Terriglobales bacterium]
MKEAVLFGELLRVTRKAHKLGIGELAERVDIGAKHLGRLERGEKAPLFELIIALANAMDVSPSVFFEFENLETDPKILKEQLVRLIETQEHCRPAESTSLT